MFKSNTNKNSQRITDEERYHKQMRKLYADSTRMVKRFHSAQVKSQNKAVVHMTKALESLVVRTTEMIGVMIGQMLTAGEISGKSMFSNFLNMLGQFSILFGTMAIAASKALEALFTGNPAGLLAVWLL